MVDCIIRNWQGQEVGTTRLSLQVAREGTAAHVVHAALVRQQANARQGTASTLTRAEVRGGGRKPFRQKGTGRARQGSSRSPLKPGGGVIFGPQPRTFRKAMNRKERRLALRTAFMNRAADMVVVKAFDEHFSGPKTKELVAAIERWGIAWNPAVKVLLILKNPSEAVQKSARNLPNVILIRADQLNVFDILHASRLVVAEDAMSTIHEIYSDG